MGDLLLSGLDLYSIKSDNQLSVKVIVLSCATEIDHRLDILYLSSIIYQREFATEIKLYLVRVRGGLFEL